MRSNRPSASARATRFRRRPRDPQLWRGRQQLGWTSITIEKTDTTATDLRTRFGVSIATLVVALTEDERITGYDQRKAALREQVARAGHDALMVFAADKVSKARELRLASEQAPQSRLQPAIGRTERDRNLAHYRRCLNLLEQRLTDSRLVTQLRTELENAPSTLTRPPR